MRTIDWNIKRNCIVLVDQTKLPTEYTTTRVDSTDELVESIQSLRVRGASALGAAGAFGVALAAHRNEGPDFETYISSVRMDANKIANARPTAVNLSREVDRVMGILDDCESIPEARKRTLALAEEVADSTIERNRRLGANGASLLSDGDQIMTHCNAGRLAGVDWGTALGIVYSARRHEKDVSVVATETRPLNQGARITTAELQKEGVETTLIPDNATGLCLQEGRVDAIVVGADRVVLDGGQQFGCQGVVYNKIGTYNIAVLADHHDVPFIVAAPHWTIDSEQTADNVEIERRDPEELRSIGNKQNAPAETDVFNPAFDPTPMEFVDYLVTETGVYEPPIDEFPNEEGVTERLTHQ